jgi:uncharacterized protein (DUF2147 family)
MKNITLSLVLAALSLSAVAQSKISPDEIIGVWITGDKSGTIEIYKTANGKYSGRILGDGNGVPDSTTLDKYNPNPALQKRRLVGLDILSGFSYEGENDWSSGTIYDPNNGKTYKCNLALDDDGKTKNKLRVRGYIGVSLFGRTDVWTRKP